MGLVAQVEAVERLDDSRSKHLLPDQVHRRFGELRMRGEHPRELRSQRQARIGPLSRQHKRRFEFAAAIEPLACQSHGAGRE